MRYLGNAFSLNMIGSDSYLRTKELSLEEVIEWLRDPLELTPWKSVAGHEDTARILSSDHGGWMGTNMKTLKNVRIKTAGRLRMEWNSNCITGH